MDLLDLEANVGRAWHRWAGKATSYPRFPDAAVTLAAVRPRLQVFFRGLGGPGGIRLSAGTDEGSTHRLSFRQWLGLGSEERLQLSVMTAESLQLPAQIDCFPETTLNERLYFWLAAYFAHASKPLELPDDPLQAEVRYLADCHATTQRVLNEWPGLHTLHGELCTALRDIRPARKLPEWEQAIENVVLHLLGAPAPTDDQSAALLACVTRGATPTVKAQRGHRPFLPVPLWGRVIEQPRVPGAGRDDTGDETATSADSDEQRRLKAKRGATDQSDRRDSLIFNRFEYLLSIAEMINVNRDVEDDDPESARRAAETVEELTIGEHSKRASSKLKLDLELAPPEIEDLALTGTFTYPEWDFTKSRYHPDHCRVIAELATEEGADWKPDRDARRRIQRVRRQFEALRPKHQVFPSEPDGDDLDLNALIRSVADHRASGAGSDNVYLRSRTAARDFAVTVLLDASLSTDSWVDNRRVLDVEKESVLALTYALTACGDEHSILAFTSRSRRRVSVSTIKSFTEMPGRRVERRLQALTPGYYTRIGAALRHAAVELQQRPNRHRLLLLLTDGKPNDVDHYEGRYGIEDTRRAVRDLRREGLTVFGITVDSKAREYFPYLFGAGGYAVVSRLARLPLVLPTLYRQLTS